MSANDLHPTHSPEQIHVVGARVNNLKNIDVSIPRNTLTVITGLSGSGKSSLAFDTLFAEGQRRYIETFSAYARNFLGNLERPDVDEITGLSPVISIEQKTTNKNPRSTVGTTTEIYDFLRLLYARVGEAFSYVTGQAMVKYTEEQIAELILTDYHGKKAYMLAPLVRGRKGHYKDLFEQTRKKGYCHVRIDGEVRELVPGTKVDRYKTHDIEVVIDRLLVSRKDHRRLKNSLQEAMRRGNGTIMMLDPDDNTTRYFSKKLMCPSSGIAYEEPSPHNFSFNSPHGACPHCKGIGTVNILDTEKIVPDKRLSIHEGGIAPLGKYRSSTIFRQIESILDKYGMGLKTPIGQLPDEALDEIMNGSDGPLKMKSPSFGQAGYFLRYEGILRYIELQQESSASATERKWAGQYSKTIVCPECKGTRLKKEALFFRIHGKNIAELSEMDIGELHGWLRALPPHLGERRLSVAMEILKEMDTRLEFLLDVGLDYLSLNRSSLSLSGGESQRIRLATQVGSQLVNVLYILDEPSIGLHQRDNRRLIGTLKQLRDTGNSVIVVEHDKDMMKAADYVVDIGPLAGRRGGEVVFAGRPDEMLQAGTLTSEYLSGRKRIEVPPTLREGNGKHLTIKGATGNNLKNVDATFPLGKLICITGVSGSGKSTLVNETLHPILSRRLYHSLKDPLPYKTVEGVEHVDKVVEVDQSPIGRTPRSNPATYTGAFTDIRNLFATLPEAKIRGYRPGRFSFNTAGGRCETCGGNGYKTIEMNFLPDVYVPCETCNGKRYNRETLEVRFKGKSIAEVLDMTVNMAVEFFENQQNILGKIKTLQDVGLGYIKLGQPSTTLSGGESQRVKLATELAKRDTGKTLYILDEPTTGLHFEDIRVLLSVLNQLVDKGNTVIVVEHNMDVIKVADHIIDMGPEGGKGGGRIVCAGTPRQVAACRESITGKYLKKELEADTSTHDTSR